ncbi:MAG TPA: YccF domain-containing protein [Thermoanaerobaculia bacterium]|nr:YccF domain-containing protein [Thermoanaerobaculia bacterium]HUM28558.1 YccF domain-containing protein [Thermoanaerobaculia bacterium]HXK66834.1 YccF domain-containing protein [Thermoanaerobaculia bacterium]
MSLIGNILWLILGGFIIFLEYMLGGFLLCLTIIGIPFGIQCWKMGILALWPFGRDVVQKERVSGCLGLIMNLLWIFLGGFWIVVTHLMFALLCAVTIIGIPFAIQHLKLAHLALVPFGREIR